jgi:hypothetical protein
MKGIVHMLETWDYLETERLEDLWKKTEVHPLIHDEVAIGNTDSTTSRNRKRSRAERDLLPGDNG